MLTQLWEQGYTQGLMLNGKKIAYTTVLMRVALFGGQWLQQIVSTTLKLLAKALVASALDTISSFLMDDSRAQTIAVTEVTRAMEQANADSLHEDEVTLVRWVTGGPDPCPLCIANEAQGPHQLGVPFVSGAVVPPQHPNCRCHIEKA